GDERGEERSVVRRLDLDGDALRPEKVDHGGVGRVGGGAELVFAARRALLGLAADVVTADDDFFDRALVHAVEEGVEGDGLVRTLGRLEEAPEEEHEDDDDDPEKYGLAGRIQVGASAMASDAAAVHLDTGAHVAGRRRVWGTV